MKEKHRRKWHTKEFQCLHLSYAPSRDAWHKLGGLPAEEAMVQYVGLVQQIVPEGGQVRGTTAAGTVVPRGLSACKAIVVAHSD